MELCFFFEGNIHFFYSLVQTVIDIAKYQYFMCFQHVSIKSEKFIRYLQNECRLSMQQTIATM